MATFPALTPSEAPIAPGAWPTTAHKSLNGAESRIRHGSAPIGGRWSPPFVNITEADYLAILAHYRGQRSGFDSFGFDATTLAADLTPAGFAWLYAGPPRVVDQHPDCFTVQCEFRCEPRGLVVAPGKDWRTGATTFTPGTRSSDGAVSAAGVNWVTPATTFTAGGGGSGGGSSGTAALAFTGGTSIAWGSMYLAYGWSFTLTSAKTIKGVGFYDEGQNGLSDEYIIVLNDDSPHNAGYLDGQFAGPELSFDAAGNVGSILVPSGTAATLDGSWRRVNLAVSGRTLPAGIYLLACASTNNLNQDNVIRSATGITTPSGVAFGKNYRWTFGYEPSHNSSFGTAYFGPMIFFE